MPLLTVSKLNQYIKNQLRDDIVLSSVEVQGEVTNFSLAQSGHMYFSLKDEEAQIRAVFLKYEHKNKVILQDGDEVILKGYVDLYAASGSLQLYVKSVERSGVGDLHLQFLALKEKLEKEGLFREERKKPLPLYPKKIGVVTAATGAVIHDIINVSTRRFPGISILLYPASVQGANAPAELIKGLQYLDTRADVDVIIIGRGGGSYEDLSSFNEESLARVIAATKKPVVSAVGHETDFTIADFVADLRAATPSAAAEAIVPNKDELLDALGYMSHRMKSLMHQRLHLEQTQLQNHMLKLKSISPMEQLWNKGHIMEQKRHRLSRAWDVRYQVTLDQLHDREMAIRSMSPLGPLERGFALIRQPGGKVYRTLQNASETRRFIIEMRDGQKEARWEENC